MNAVVSLARASALDERVLDDDVLARSYARLGLTPGGPDSLLARARSLETHLLTQGQHIVQCSECGGLSPADYPECPYCGESDDASVSAKAQDALAQCILELHAHKQAGEMYQVGRLLLRVRDERLWRARLQRDGTPAWASFKVFVSEELGLGVTWAYELLSVARVFSERDVSLASPGKLMRILCAPREAREELLAMARAGASRGVLEKHIALARLRVAPGPPRAKKLEFSVPDGREWEIPLVVRQGSGPPVPAREVGSLEVLGAATLAPNTRLVLRITREVDGTLRGRARLVRTKPAPRSVKAR